MLQLEKVDYLVYFYEHQLGEPLILDEAFDITSKDKRISGWIVTIEGQLIKLNLGNKELKKVLINAILPNIFHERFKSPWECRSHGNMVVHSHYPYYYFPPLHN
jgi:hypothetical protein